VYINHQVANQKFPHTLAVFTPT